jgi:phosphatase NudJ
MARKSIPTWYFVLVVARYKDHFLMVHERKAGESWYLPAGRVEPGEDLIAAAQRETLEEAGVEVAINGVIRVEHSPRSDGTARVRVIFSATPRRDEPVPKSAPDEHSLEAAWVSLHQVDQLELRGDDVKEIFRYVEDGGTIYPLDVITHEGAPMRYH